MEYLVTMTTHVPEELQTKPSTNPTPRSGSLGRTGSAGTSSAALASTAATG